MSGARFGLVLSSLPFLGCVAVLLSGGATSLAVGLLAGAFWLLACAFESHLNAHYREKKGKR